MSPKSSNLGLTGLSPEPAPPEPEHEDLNAWYFIRAGLGLNLFVAVLLVVAAPRGRNADTVATVHAMVAFFSVAIWGGIALVAIPTLLVQMVRRTRAHRKSLLPGKSPGIWDGWIDGPGTS
jgi:hypothetical protein